MNETWLVEENINRFRALLTQACDEIRRKTLTYLLEREEEKLRNLTPSDGIEHVPSARSSDTYDE